MTALSDHQQDLPTGLLAISGDPRSAVDCRLALNRGIPVPLWAQIDQFLAAAIADGRLRPGESPGSESELCRRFHVSRGTIRQALANLSRRGLVSRSKGRGTRVIDPDGMKS